jgi:hypothetical protein
MDQTTLFLDEATLTDHHRVQSEQRPAYLAALLLLLAHRIELSPGARARALAAAWARRDDDLGAFLLEQPQWDLTAVARAVQLLDAGRQARVLRRRIARLEAEGRVRPRRLGHLRSTLNDLVREGEGFSFSGALARKVRAWVRTIPADKLVFYALTFPLAPWRTLADLCHLAPGDFQLPWFLPVAFGAAPPEDTALAACNVATAAELPALAERFRVPYSSLRVRVPPEQHPPALRTAVAGYESLDTLLWYYEELRCPAVDGRIAERLRAGDEPGFGYGKLMERLFAARDLKVPFWELLLPVAERQIDRHVLPIDPPVVVLGDASSSMTVAIRVATIIGSVLALLARADLRFFNHQLINSPVVPRRIADVLKVTDTIRAVGSTAPAAALWPSLARRELVRSFMVVTDEEENSECKGQRFDAMLEQYRRECHAAHVVFISFLDQRQPGQMVTALKARGIACRQFRLDPRRPDLTKLDEILGHLSLTGSLYRERLTTVAEWATETRLPALAERVAALLDPAATEAPAPGRSLWQRVRGLFGR